MPSGVDDVGRREFVVGAAALASLVLAGCGGGSDDDTSNPEVEPSTEPARPAARRVVALGEEQLLADLLAIGVRPVASTAAVAERGFWGLDDFDTAGIEPLSSTEADVERLASLRPDVIVCDRSMVDQLGRAALERLGELVVLDDDPAARLEQLAESFEVPKAATDLLNGLKLAIGRARQELGSEGRAVSVATVDPAGSVAAWVAGPSEVPDALLALGFVLQPSADEVDGESGGRITLSPEQVVLLDADTLVTLQSELVEGEAGALRDIASDPSWSGLPAVAAGKVVQLDRLGYPGVAGRRRLVEDLREKLREP